MKAEQRKELETNTLADRMGLVVQKVKGSQRRTFFIYLGVVAGVLFALFFAYRWWKTEGAQASLNWVQLHDGTKAQLDHLATLPNEQGKAARFQLAWFKYWEDGVKSLGVNPHGGILSMKEARDEYQALAKLCKDDAVFEPQAMLGEAVCEESLAIQDRKRLVKAKELYEALVNHEKYGDAAGDKISAEAKFAKGRLEILKDNDKREALGNELDRLSKIDMLNIQPAMLEDLFKAHPELGKKKGP
jgi:hypothetical protein